MFWSLVRPDRILPPITSSAAVTTSLEAGELAVVMITCGGRNRGRMTYDGQRCERILRRLLPPAIVGYAASWPIRNANLVKAMLIATRASAGARKRRSTRPSRTPFQHPIRFQSSSRRRAGAPIVPDPFHGGWRGRCLYEPRRLHGLLQE